MNWNPRVTVTWRTEKQASKMVATFQAFDPSAWVIHSPCMKLGKNRWKKIFLRFPLFLFSPLFFSFFLLFLLFTFSFFSFLFFPIWISRQERYEDTWKNPSSREIPAGSHERIREPRSSLNGCRWLNRYKFAIWRLYSLCWRELLSPQNKRTCFNLKIAFQYFFHFKTSLKHYNRVFFSVIKLL